MNLIDIIILILYFSLGILSGISIEHLMKETNTNDLTNNFERFMWVTFWPIFVLLFLFGIKK